MSATAPAAHYNRVIPAWGYLLGDNLHFGFFEKGNEDLTTATEALSRHMAQRAEMKPGLSVVDVGCGTGAPAAFLAKEHGCNVTGISTSEVSVQSAGQRAASLGLGDKAKFVIGNGMEMPFPDASFDRAWVMESSHLMPDKGKLLKECARVLRPSGVVVLCDVIQRDVITTAEVIARRREYFLVRDVYGDAKTETLERYRELAEGAGLRVDSLEDISAETKPTFERWRENGRANKARVIELIGNDGWQSFMDSCDVFERLFDERKLGYGLVRFTKV